MKRIYSALHFGLIIPLVFFFTALCCCVGGKAHAGTMGESSYQSMTGGQSHSCCPSKKDSHTPKCKCHNISVSASDTPQKWLSLKPYSSLTVPFINGINSFVVAFIPSTSLSFYNPLFESSQSTPPIYLLDRVFRL